MDDIDFGRIEERRPGSWERNDFQLWSYTSIQVMIDVGQDGPSQAQRAFVRSLREEGRELQARIEQAVSQRAGETISQVGQLKLSSIYIPQTPQEQIWRVWYDIVGEEHYWFGAEIKGWDAVTAFVED